MAAGSTSLSSLPLPGAESSLKRQRHPGGAEARGEGDFLRLQGGAYAAVHDAKASL